MKKIIFKNFLRETTIFFLLSCSSVALIVWVIQAVNYLGFVTEDGHGFKINYLYTIISLQKIINLEQIRKDPNIAMPLCKLGCDDLFEKKYLIVDSEGMIQKNEERIGSELENFLEQYKNKKC